MTGMEASDWIGRTYRKKRKPVDDLVACKTHREYVKKEPNVEGDDSDQSQMITLMCFDAVEEFGILDSTPDNL